MDGPLMGEDTSTYQSRNGRKTPFHIFLNDARLIFKRDELGLEIAQIALPAALALAADPIASLVDTAFIGHIGPVELAAVGVSIAIFNQVSRVAIFPLVSVTTSFVAEEDAACKMMSTEERGNENLEEALPLSSEMKNLPSHLDSGKDEYHPFIAFENQNMAESRYERRYIPSVSSALVIGGVLGVLQAVLLIFAAKPVLNFMGVQSMAWCTLVSDMDYCLGHPMFRRGFTRCMVHMRDTHRGWTDSAQPYHKDSPMLNPAQQYLTLRSLGAPAVLLSLAMQGVFRGFKDTKTPLYATVAGDLTNIILDPIFMFVFRLGVSGAAIAHVISQYLMSLILLLKLMEKVDVLPPSIKDLQFSRFLKNGSLLLVRVVAVTFCVTLAASMAARQGPICMAAFQICLQIWLTTSLLADGLAVAAQAILASAFARNDRDKAMATTSRVLQLSLVMGLSLAAFLGIGLQFAWRLFTKDVKVMQLMRIGIPFVAATQPINAVAFVFDGINFGASDFAYSAHSMIIVAILSIVCLFLLSSSYGFVGIWIALTIYMSMRMFAGFGRIGSASGPWKFLRN